MTISSRDEIEVGQALRRYVSARAHGRTHPEYARLTSISAAGGDLAAWVGTSEVEARGRCDGRDFYQVRRPGLPWCQWLGLDTCIAGDHALQAFFELHATEPHHWQRLLHEVSRGKGKALREWRQRGRQAITHLTRQAEIGPDVRLPSDLADEFAVPGKGMRSLRKSFDVV
ncbi:hypothetical protein [Aminobacter sp. AP02]|uniref:hypothetical protein n=1 Tax=Aminobacter sp. AP02 TaxID=2135737 RepID=UPI000D6D49FD|nr:hypothetical protein [Aminobacter sp. AP02]PWK64641.1 hypothetical protein C8K44_11982 [Aminobacter sp. AP02]